MKPKSYANKKFGDNKARLEEYKLSLVEGPGGWFGLPHVMFHTHFYNYVPYLVPNYPFFAVERDRGTFNMMRQGMIALMTNNVDFDDDYEGGFTDNAYYETGRNSIIGQMIEYYGELIVKHGDLFDTLFSSYPATKYIQNGSGKIRKPQYSYGHLDFCCTAATLTDEHIEFNLRKLAKWWNLKSPFHLDITVALRGDANWASANLLLQHAIPTIFQQLHWNLKSYFTTTYSDTSNKMATGFYVFYKDYSYTKNGGGS